MAGRAGLATNSFAVNVHGTSGSPLNGWKLGWTFPGDQKITNLWNGTVRQSGAKGS